jgi:hypothetical protein
MNQRASKRNSPCIEASGTEKNAARPSRSGKGSASGSALTRSMKAKTQQEERGLAGTAKIGQDRSDLSRRKSEEDDPWRSLVNRQPSRPRAGTVTEVRPARIRDETEEIQAAALKQRRDHHGTESSDGHRNQNNCKK